MVTFSMVSMFWNMYHMMAFLIAAVCVLDIMLTVHAHIVTAKCCQVIMHIQGDILGVCEVSTNCSSIFCDQILENQSHLAS